MTYRILIGLLALIVMWIGCTHNPLRKDKTIAKLDLPDPITYDLAEIREKGVLTALTDNSSTSFFIYKGQPMGYEYELLKMFCNHADLELKIELVDNIDEIFYLLNTGKGDIVAANMTVTKDRSEQVSFTEHLLLTKQVLIQQIPANAKTLTSAELEAKLIRNPIDLIGKEIHVRKNSSFYSRLISLSNEIGGDIELIEAPGDLETEHLIKKVALGEIQFTVADENIAMINKTYYKNIDIKTAISFDQKIAWAVRKNSPNLLSALNIWINSMRNNVDYITVYNKYFKSSKDQRERATNDFSSLKGERFSKFDRIIQVRAKHLDWDWKLLASQIYQESHFNPNSRSWAGALGLMQIMPQTAAQYGNYNLLDPADNIKVGTTYLSSLENYWKDKIPNKDERIKFVLASYNAGLGHVIDARRLAIKLKKDPNIWFDNVADCILLKSKNQYYTDDVVKHGYCRGEEPFNYVKEILERYEDYQNVMI